MTSIDINIESTSKILNKNLRIKRIRVIQINEIIDYRGNGYYIGDQLKDLGNFNIPDSKSVKSVKINFSSTFADDYLVVIIDGKRFYKLRNGFSYVINWEQEYDISLNTDNINIKAGINDILPTHKCRGF
ncbi:hypothetical protein JJB27_09980 [Campylobacter fetus subsp. venerealis]|uniref:hypothetical protein n=1 Tax=Campylobacter fetus TaxID=196 RepID=UPI001909E675|nr:hypothetical protein [Campylobacter fetus]MBK3499388.1 hypothetical protein [Campylobacter fetus subsp. venerealis]MBK3503348.1 hypothetical protein [Campylobacter fetus subsp. venerealis]